jgi:hypothetical protein
MKYPTIWLHSALVITMFFIYWPAAIALLVIGTVCRYALRAMARAMLGLSPQPSPAWRARITPVHLFLAGVTPIVLFGVYTFVYTLFQ